jgi:transcription-repair coupling factor (superfamily II helicase)
MAARDLSVITTPPPNRYPIDTNVVGFSEELIRMRFPMKFSETDRFSLLTTALRILRLLE